MTGRDLYEEEHTSVKHILLCENVGRRKDAAFISNLATVLENCGLFESIVYVQLRSSTKTHITGLEAFRKP